MSSADSSIVPRFLGREFSHIARESAKESFSTRVIVICMWDIKSVIIASGSGIFVQHSFAHQGAYSTLGGSSFV